MAAGPVTAQLDGRDIQEQKESECSWQAAIANQRARPNQYFSIESSFTAKDARYLAEVANVAGQLEASEGPGDNGSQLASGVGLAGYKVA